MTLLPPFACPSPNNVIARVHVACCPFAMKSLGLEMVWELVLKLEFQNAVFFKNGPKPTLKQDQKPESSEIRLNLKCWIEIKKRACK